MRRITSGKHDFPCYLLLEEYMPNEKYNFRLGILALSGTFGRYRDDAIYYTHTIGILADRSFLIWNTTVWEFSGGPTFPWSVPKKTSLQNSSSTLGVLTFKKTWGIYETAYLHLRGFLGDNKFPWKKHGISALSWLRFWGAYGSLERREGAVGGWVVLFYFVPPKRCFTALLRDH